MDLTKNGWECHKPARGVTLNHPNIYIFMSHALNVLLLYSESRGRERESRGKRKLLKFRLHVQFVGCDLIRVVQYVL
jgi:hypothetical protein